MSFTKDHRLSFEFFPPKTEVGFEKLIKVRSELASFSPEFFSVTYGAGGSTRDNTKTTVLAGLQEGHNIAPHLSFGGDDEASILKLITEYKDKGVTRLVALRGDLPSGFGKRSRLVHANELVQFIRQHFGEHFHLEVAAYPEIHPEAESYDVDIEFLKNKFDDGANSAITQYFFNVDAYQFFIDNCTKQGIDKPIYPGVMPIINFDNLKRFSKNCGADIPRWLSYRIEALEGKPEEAQKFCLDFIAEFCEKLLAVGAPGLHFYTMNQTEPTRAICQRLGL